jgi:hypothetical protein
MTNGGDASDRCGAGARVDQPTPKPHTDRQRVVATVEASHSLVGRGAGGIRSGQVMVERGIDDDWGKTRGGSKWRTRGPRATWVNSWPIGSLGLLARPGKKEKNFGFSFKSFSNHTEKSLFRAKWLEASEKSEILAGGKLEYLEQLLC